MSTFFVGDIISPDGHAYHCAGTRVRSPKIASSSGALVLLDSLSPLYGSDVPVPNEQGWVVRPLAGDVTTEHAVSVLSQCGRVIETPSMLITEVIKKVGKGAIKGLPDVPA